MAKAADIPEQTGEDYVEMAIEVNIYENESATIWK